MILSPRLQQQVIKYLIMLSHNRYNCGKQIEVVYFLAFFLLFYRESSKKWHGNRKLKLKFNLLRW